MIIIKSKKEKDTCVLFNFLLHNCNFSGLPNNKFKIHDNEIETVKRIKEHGIEIIIL